MSRINFSACEFKIGATNTSHIPSWDFPEIAFIGRSNVGKSSLLNAITSTNIARVSKTPGRTQQINFFSIANKFSLVDLPGYGYAAVSLSTRRIWNDIIVDYLINRTQLKRVFLLIDARHGIMKNDYETMQLLDTNAVIYQIILTKADKLKSISSVITQTKEQIARHGAAYPEVIATSSTKKDGILEIQKTICKIIQ